MAQAEQVCITEVLDGRIYLGNLAAARDVERRNQLGITRVLSVCPDYPSEGGDHHEVIDVEDDEYQDILVHLPGACAFIQRAVDRREKVLVHCKMGISRSATVVAAYLMKSQGMDASTALRYLTQKRHQIHPNYGFIKQLEAFEKCKDEESLGPLNPVYKSWKRRHRQDVTCYLNRLEDVALIIPDRLMLMSHFPEDEQQGRSLLANIGITHLVTLSPAGSKLLPRDALRDAHHIEVPEEDPDSVMDLLLGAVTFIQRAAEQEGRVMIYSENEPRACMTACAYLVATGRATNSEEARAVVQEAVLLGEPPEAWQRRLKLLDEPSFKQSLEDALSAATVSTASDASGSSPGSSSGPGTPDGVTEPLYLPNPAQITGKPFKMEGVMDALSAIQEISKKEFVNSPVVAPRITASVVA
ncbi:dual specificity protein phosphatase 13 [Coprinopsis cinerea AmutBmut pab1-1]|nr:dual specificity protein phosphatase 13 [Coprinopsis cinerea AmutBmut pab1-1]